jgi:aspartate/methionine/tyrosine aminotransferase
VRYDTIEYLDWIIGLNWEPECDLGSSEPLLEATPERLGLSTGDILINGHNALGYENLRQHLAQRHGVSVENVLLSQGASMANFLLCASLISPGDEVVVERPAYEPLFKVPQLLGATLRRVDRRFETGYSLDPSDLKRMLSKRTRLIILSNLHNPSGTLLSQDVLTEVGRLAASVGAHVLVDEIYLEFLFDDTPPSAFHLEGPFVITNSLTKVYGLGGLRVGWALCPPDLVRRAQKLYFTMGVHHPMCAETFGHLVLSRPSVWERWSREVRQRINTNRLILNEFLRGRDDLEWVEPAGGVMVFPRIRGDFPATRLADLLRCRYGTFIIPGRFFEDDRHFRLAWGAAPEVLRRGLDHVASALSELAQDAVGN